MNVLKHLATSLNRRDEIPNQELAKQIAAQKDQTAIKELIANLNNKNKGIQSDCIKVLYEIGTQNPKLITPYAAEFIALLHHKNNRLQWGAMTALSAITSESPKLIYASLPKILAAADKGSVITKDHAVNILIKLSSIKPYADSAFSLLIEQLRIYPTNQLAMYAERSASCITDKNKKNFVDALRSRLGEIEKETMKKRIEKVIINCSHDLPATKPKPNV